MNDSRRLTPSINNAPAPARIPDENVALSIVSCSRLLRDGLVSLLAPYLPVRLVGSYSGNAMPDADMPNPHCHMVLIDCGIGQEATHTWIRWWRTRSASVLVIEVENDKDAILDYIEMGAVGYVLKEAPPSEVAQAVRHASRGLALCSPEITAHLFARLAARSAAQPPPAPAAVSLTAREMEVLRCIAQGMSNKEIAAELVIEIYTVKHHVHNILEKMNLRHRYEAVRYAAEHGWIADPIPPQRSKYSI